MAESIGEKLRLARETQGVALRDISEQTRISMRYLEAIEADDYGRLPGGIFNRSFIRAYAKFINYDERQAIDEYAETLRERGEPDEDSTRTYKSLVYTDDAGGHRSPLKNLVLALLILAALTVCVLGGLHLYRRSLASRAKPGTGQRFDPGKRNTNGRLLMPGAYHNREGEDEFTV
jgi:cytoskeletal protein RodZ